MIELGKAKEKKDENEIRELIIKAKEEVGDDDNRFCKLIFKAQERLAEELSGTADGSFTVLN